MRARRKLYRLMITTLLASAAAAPVATAMPADHVHYSSKAYVPTSAAMDMHASTVLAAASKQQDLRGEGSIPSSRVAAPSGIVAQDLRGEGSIPSSRVAAPSGIVAQDLRSENVKDPSQAPEPVAPRSQHALPDDGGGIEWPAVLALIGALALGGGLLVAGRRSRTQTPVAG